MNDNYTHVTILFDRSDSMSSIREATNNALNKFIADQRKLKDKKCTLSVYQFNHHCDCLYTGKDIQTADWIELNPNGSTAMFDSIMTAMDETGEYLKNMNENDRPAKVFFVLATDGYENSSVKHRGLQGRQAVFDAINHQRDKYDWEFVYLAANQDAIASALNIGIPTGNAMNYSHDSAGVTEAVRKMSDRMSEVRTCCVGSAKTSNFFDGDQYSGTPKSLVNK